MSHDDTYAFLVIGRDLERADMTTRVLDVQAGILIGQSDGASPYADLMWMGVLRSLSAHQMFRRIAGPMVSGPAALRFLLRDPQFPRSVERCLIEISRALLELCRHNDPMAGCAEVQQLLERADLDSLGGDGPSAAALHDYADRLQQGLGRLHELLVTTYFQMEPSTSTGAHARMSIRVALEHRTSYRFDRAVRLSPHVVRLRPAPHCRTPVLVLLADGHAPEPLHQLAAGPLRQPLGPSRVPRAGPPAHRHGRPGRRPRGHQPVRLLRRGVSGALPVQL